MYDITSTQHIVNAYWSLHLPATSHIATHPLTREQVLFAKGGKSGLKMLKRPSALSTGLGLEWKNVVAPAFIPGSLM